MEHDPVTFRGDADIFRSKVSKDILSSHNASVGAPSSTSEEIVTPHTVSIDNLDHQSLVRQLGPSDAHGVGGVSAGVLEFDSSMFRVGSGMMLHEFRRVRDEIRGAQIWG